MDRKLGMAVRALLIGFAAGATSVTPEEAPEVVPGRTDCADIETRHRHLRSLGISGNSIVDLEYHDYARSKYRALGIPDTMPRPSVRPLLVRSRSGSSV